VATVYPAKWDYHRGGEAPTTEVAITVRLSEDVYVVLTGYDTEQGMSNFRVFINPLISWVWIGFLVLALGVFVCLLPASLATYVSARPPRTRIGHAADVGLVMALVIGATLAIASQAHAAPTAPAEHSAREHAPAGMGMGDSSVGYAAMNRPTTDLQARTMKELICPCGCARQDIFSCPCGTAADLRRDVIEQLAGFDQSTPAAQDKAYEAVLAGFVEHYKGEQVLATPRSSFSWLLPTLAVVGGLGLIFVVGKRWIVRGTGVSAAPVTHGSVADNEDYVDKLDDELRDVD